MKEFSKTKLKYSKGYKMILLITQLLLIGTIIFMLSNLYHSPIGFDFDVICLVVGVVILSILSYKLFRYYLYVLNWYAYLHSDGIELHDPRRGTFDYQWSYVVLKIVSFNLCLCPASDAICEVKENGLTDYRISKWLNGHKLIIDSFIEFIAEEKAYGLLDNSRVVEDLNYSFYRFLNMNKWNMVFIGFVSSCSISILFILYILLFDIVFFDSGIALVILILTSIHILFTFQYWNLLPVIMALIQVFTCCISILAFSYIMYDNVHFKNELFFLIWGLLFGLFLTLAIFMFIYLYRRNILSLPSKVLFRLFLFGVFMLSLFSGAFLKVGNIIDSEISSEWERGTAIAPLLLIAQLGVDPDYVKFDNEEWGNRRMGLFFINWSKENDSEKRLEFLTYKGRLGIPWIYNNYLSDETQRVKDVK